MAAERVTVLRIEIEDRPGALHEMLAGTARADANVLNLAALSLGGGRGIAFCVTEKPDEVRGMAESRGASVDEYAGFLLGGRDRVGIGAEATKPVADAGINIVLATATVAGGEYYLLIAVGEKDAERVLEVLGS